MYWYLFLEWSFFCACRMSLAPIIFCFGFLSFSSLCRHGDQRRVSVYKSKLQMETVKFSEKTKTVLDDLFSMYPPDDGELGKETVGNHHKKADKPRRRKDDIFWRPSMTKEELTKKVGSYTLKNVANMKKVSLST